MDFNFPTYRRNTDGTYGPTLKEHLYKPVKYHSRIAIQNRRKSRWVLNESQQYNVFKIADEGEWICENNKCLFSIINNGDIIVGLNNERIAKFPEPRNITDSWHGYPTTSSKDEISDDLLDKWESLSIITPGTRRRIARGAI